jgi:hypothetical protein
LFQSSRGAVYLITAGGGTADLSISGDASAQNLSIQMNSSGVYTLTLSGGGPFSRVSDPSTVVSGNGTNTITFSAANVRDILIDMGGGNDTLTLTGDGGGFRNPISLSGGTNGANDGGSDVLNNNVVGGATFLDQLEINQFETVNLNQSLDVSRGTALLSGSFFSALTIGMNPFFSTPTVHLATNAGITVHGGALTTQVNYVLDGNGGVNLLSADGAINGSDAGLQFTSVSGSSGAGLTIRADGIPSLSTININGPLSVTVDHNNNESSSLFVESPLTASSVSLNGTGGNDALSISRSVTATTGSLTFGGVSGVSLFGTAANSGSLAAGSGNIVIPGTLTLGSEFDHGPYAIAPPAGSNLVLGTSLSVNFRGTTAGGSGDGGFSQLVVSTGGIGCSYDMMLC